MTMMGRPLDDLSNSTEKYNNVKESYVKNIFTIRVTKKKILMTIRIGRVCTCILLI